MKIIHATGIISRLFIERATKERRIVCDVALSSNIRLGVVKDLPSHPIVQMLRQGIPVTLNTDDSLFFETSLLNEYELARSLGLSDDELAQIAKNSITFSGLAGAWQDEALSTIENWLISRPS